MESNKITILITGKLGAISGIGFETVKALAVISSSFHILLGCRLVEKGQNAPEEIKSELGDNIKTNISVLQIDICNQGSIEAAKMQIEGQFGKLDVLINNAGIIVYHQVDTMTSPRQSFETNVFGHLAATETLEALLRKSAKPYVIYISSEQGSITKRFDPEYEFHHVRGDHYRMSKAGLNMLAACHRYNFANWGCKVLALNPGCCVFNLTGKRVMRC